MLNFRTILGLIAAGSVMVDNPLPKKIISKVICVVASVVLSAVMIGALLLAGIMYAYQLMTVRYDFGSLEASLYIVGAMGLLSTIAVIFVVCSIRKLVDALPKSLKKNVPLTTHLGNEATQVVQSFINGLMGKTERHHDSSAP